MGVIITDGSAASSGTGGNYLTVVELKAAKDTKGETISVGDYTDAELDEMIDRYEELVEMWTNDRFYSFTATYVFDGTGHRYQFFPPSVPYKLLTVTSVKDVDFDGTELTSYTESSDFVNHSHFLELNVQVDFRRIIGTKGVWPLGQQNVQVVGTWGHASTPKPIKELVKRLCMEEISPGSSGWVAGGIRLQEWDDYKVEYANYNLGDKTITGWVQADKIVEKYLNRSAFLAGMYIAGGEFHNCTLLG